jgi:hypothetical protein
MNWRDDARNSRDYADYEAEERARGHRETPDRTDLVNDLPDFHHAAPLHVIPAPRRMTRAAIRAAQLASAEAATAGTAPVATAAAAELATATAKRAAVVAEIRATTQEALSKLDQIVEQLVLQHTSGAVIDAAWAASKRIFKPKTGGRS